MTLLLAFTVLLSLMAIYFVLSSYRQIRRGRFTKAGGSMGAGLVTASLGGFGILVSTSYLGYEHLTDEERVGVIEFSQIDTTTFEARLMIDGERDRIMTLKGDEWQLDARIVSWTPPMTVLGLEPIYQLERVSGRYTDIDRELSEERTVHALYESRPVDLWSVAQDFPLVPGIDAYYGTATYLPMAAGARYEIRLSRDALIARPVNDAARTAVGDWGQR
jgi:hypothetical protein